MLVLIVAAFQGLQVDFNDRRFGKSIFLTFIEQIKQNQNILLFQFIYLCFILVQNVFCAEGWLRAVPRNVLFHSFAGILQVPDSNETSFIAQCIEAAALLIAIEAHLIDLEFVDAVGGRETKLFRLFCSCLFVKTRNRS